MSTLCPIPPSEDSLCTPLEPLQSAKYLGSYITRTSSSVPDVNFRCSQASSAFKTLDAFSDILSFPKNSNYRSTHKSFRLFSSMVQNHKYTLQHKSPKLIVYITKLSDKYSRSRAHSTIGSFFLLAPLPRMNTCFPFHSFDLYSFIPSNLRFQAEIFRTYSQTSFIP